MQNIITIDDFDKFTTKDKHVYIYIRISTGKQDITNQLNEVYNYCLNERLYPVSANIYIDEGVSGKVNWKERKINDIINMVKKNDIIIVPEISRLGRNMTEVNHIVAICNEKRVIVHDIKNKIKLDGSFQASIMANLHSMFAQMERQLISERTKQGLLVAKQKGHLTGRKRGIKKNKLIEPYIDLIKSRLNEKYSIRKIASEINVNFSYLAKYINKHNLRNNIQETKK